MTSKFTRRLLGVLVPLAVIVLVMAGRNWVRQPVRAAGETNELQQVLRDEEKRASSLATDGAAVLARIREKNTIAEELIAGRSDLARAAARFRELHAGNANYLALLRIARPALSDDELVCRNVIDYCATRLQGRAEQTAVINRLEQELAAMNKPRITQQHSKKS